MFTTTALAFAFSLSADAFAVSLAKGAQFRHLTVRQSLVIATGFAVLETLTPLLGWLIGSSFGPWLAAADHWVAFGLLGLLGLRMLRRQPADAKSLAARVAPGWLALAVTAMGTSVDGLAVGVTMALVVERIVPLLATIALVTFGLVWFGLQLGYVAGNGLGRPVQVLGGLGLIGIGTKILVEHLMAS
jgi:manganese efflux pump family protein